MHLLKKNSVFFNDAMKSITFYLFETLNASDSSIPQIFDELGNVTWNNQEYHNLWQRIPPKFKELLNKDKDWLSDYMNNCIKLRKNRKPCKIILPSQTTFPPVLLENGEYDFNSEIVNKLFNRLEKSYQTTLLTLYSTKDGVKNYDSFKDAIERILAKEVDFGSGFF